MDLVSFAHQGGRSATKSVGREQQKRLGQFMTPPEIAHAMAARACTGIQTPNVRILDPAAGAGILAAAVVNELLGNPEVRRIDLCLCEIDPRFKRHLSELIRRLRAACKSREVEIRTTVRIGDFLMSDLAADTRRFDLVISNPPYFKLGKSDPRSRRHSYAVYGQPNIYGLFMAACARVLQQGGRWCFITPRSWTNGPYFAACRRHLLRYLNIDAMHVFESREQHFTEDDVLQEAMITWATSRSPADGPVVLSTSEGVHDLCKATLRTVRTRDVISTDPENVIRLPYGNEADVLNGFSSTLGELGMRVSTGPVVAFRAAEYLRQSRSKATVPLLWMQHIRRMAVTWPINKKREHIVANVSTSWMLVSNSNMVLMRRFSAKEDARRITAAPYIAGTFPGEYVGLENHTNYLYRASGQMTRDEAFGLAAYLNSTIVDQYLRSLSGNTQVNAADLKTLPLPSLATLERIGRLAQEIELSSDIDMVIERALRAPEAGKAAA